MLNWFNKIKKHFFDNEDKIEIDNDNDLWIDEEDDQVAPTTIAPRRSNLYTPIVSDAEIYGWQDQESETAQTTKARAIITELKDDFKPVPLYQNEFWPGKNQVVHVHKAQDHKTTVKNEQPPTELLDSRQNYLETHFEQHLEGKSERFTPTKVASPIYGYKNVSRKERVKKFEEEPFLEENRPLLEEGQVESDNSTKALQDKVNETSQEVINKHQVASDEVFENDPQQSIVLAEDDPVNLQVEKVETEHTIDEMEIPKQERMEDFPRQIIAQNEPLEKQEENAETAVHEPLEITSAAVDQEVDHLTNVDEVEQEELEEEPIVEKVVPFNVLMLKRDKQKLAAQKIRDEMIAVEEKELVDQQESVKEIESVQKELIDEIEYEQKSIEPILSEKEQLEVSENLQQQEEIEEKDVSTVPYVMPNMDYLMPPEAKVDDQQWLDDQSRNLEESLSHFGVEASVIDAVQGPTVTRFELTVGQGTKVSRVRNLIDDLKLALAARDIRIQAPIPGTSSIGIEIPNRTPRAVRISEVLQTDAFLQSESPMEAVLGLGLTGEPVTIDLRKMPHGLIAGATGSGKSVCINSILISLLYKAAPSDLQMMLIDPKMVELAPFNGIPHLISPVITDVKAATVALKWAVDEMERRYELLAHAGVRDIERYNKQAIEHRQFSRKMPYLLIVIDELADLMMIAPGDVEISISRIAQKARACGIHLIIATQRPSVDVITGIIKANIPTRIAFSVSSQVDSRTMIDTNGAERLLGKGDLLYIGNGESSATRLQGTFVTDEEIERIIEHVQREAEPNYLFGQDELLKMTAEENEDPLFMEACEFIVAQNSASTSMLQRNFSIGYNRAAKLMDRLEVQGFISPQQGSKARDVYLNESDLETLRTSKL